LANTNSSAKVAVVIPYYQGEDFIADCLKSINKSEYPVSKIYLADNSPARFQPPGPGTNLLTVLKLPPGIGFGRACNAGIYQSVNDGYDFTIILNQDAVLATDCVGHLVAACQQQPNLAAVAPLSYDHDLLAITPPTWAKYVAPIPGLAADLQRGELRSWYPVSYTQINGACVCFRNQLVHQYPLFDPIFKQYGEDTELFQRLLYQHHFALGVVPEARIGHQHTNFTAQGSRADNIAVQVRRGMLICWLKDPRRSLFGSLVKALVVALHTQWQTLWAGQAQRLPLFWRQDWQLLFQLPEIVKRRDPSFLQGVIEGYLHQDLEGQKQSQ